MKIRADEPCIIIHKGKVVNQMLFQSISEARNVFKFLFPNKKFKETEKNTFVCARYGTRYEIVLLFNYPSIEDF